MKNNIALVIDDSEINQDILKGYLEKRGYQTFVALDGKDGLEKFKLKDPAIIFLDIVMPKVNGFELLKQIREIDSKVIIIMVTSFISRDSLSQAKEAKADWMLKKPFNENQLIKILDMFENIKTFSKVD